MSKKIDFTLIPRYEGKQAIEYERIWSTIRKTRLYKLICVLYSQPLVIVNARHFYSSGCAIFHIFVEPHAVPA